VRAALNHEERQIPVKVLMVNTYHYRRAGAEVHALDLAEHLRQHGHEVRFFSMRHPDNIESEDSKYWVPEIDYRVLNAAKSPANAWRVLSRAIYSVPTRKALARMLDDWRPDVAHLHNIHHHLTPSIVVELNARAVPVVWTLHDYKLICPNQGLETHGALCERCKGGRFMQCTVQKCKKDSRSASFVATLEAEAHRFLRLRDRVASFIAPSAFLRGKFIEFGWPPDKLVHMANFNNLPLAAEVEMPEGRRVLFAGQLEWEKGVLTLLDALEHVAGVRLDIAGDGPLRGQIEARVAALGAGDAEVHVHGHVSKDVLGGLIDAARVVAVPSQWYENSPYSVIEAFAHARPVVASRIGGLPELVVDGVNGAVVEPGDADGFARAILRLLDDPESWRRCAEGALATAASRDATGYIARLEALYSGATDGTVR
jgi:glycosyltransferase involved in cell wall biosynthesis